MLLVLTAFFGTGELTAFFGDRQGLLWVPLPFLAGWLLLERWLLPERGADRILAVCELVHRRRIRPSLVKAALAASRSRRAANLVHKDQLARVGKGEVDYNQYKRTAAELERGAAHRAGATLRGWPVHQLALRLGPSGPSWENGVRAARYGPAGRGAAGRTKINCRSALTEVVTMRRIVAALLISLDGVAASRTLGTGVLSVTYQPVRA